MQRRAVRRAHAAVGLPSWRGTAAAARSRSGASPAARASSARVAAADRSSGGVSARQSGSANGQRAGEAAAAAAARSCSAPCPRSPQGAPPAPLEPRHRAEQPDRVGMLRLREQRRRPAPARRSRPAYITTTSSADLGHHAEIVGDEDDRCAGLLAQLAHQVEDLRLDRDVERRRRLVGDQERRARRPAPSRSSRAAACRRTAGADTRRSARPGDGMRTRSQHLDARCARGLLRATARGGARSASTICSPIGEGRVQRRHRLLEDHGDAGCRAGRACARRQRRADRGLRTGSGPTTAPAGLRQQPHDRQRGHALAAARFADDAERLAALRPRSSRRRPRRAPPRSPLKTTRRSSHLEQRRALNPLAARASRTPTRASITSRSITPTGSPRVRQARGSGPSARGSPAQTRAAPPSGSAWSSTRRSRADSPRRRRCRSAADCLPRLSPPASSPAFIAAISRRGKGRAARPRRRASRESVRQLGTKVSMRF